MMCCKCPGKQKPNTLSEGESWTLRVVAKDKEIMACRAEKPCCIREKTRAGGGGGGGKRKNPADKERKEERRCAERREVMEVQGIQDTGCKLAGQA